MLPIIRKTRHSWPSLIDELFNNEYFRNTSQVWVLLQHSYVYETLLAISSSDSSRIIVVPYSFESLTFE